MKLENHLKDDDRTFRDLFPCPVGKTCLKTDLVAIAIWLLDAREQMTISGVENLRERKYVSKPVFDAAHELARNAKAHGWNLKELKRSTNPMLRLTGEEP